MLLVMLPPTVNRLAFPEPSGGVVLTSRVSSTLSDCLKYEFESVDLEGDDLPSIHFLLILYDLRTF